MSTITVTWVEPVIRADGTALALSDIANTEVLLSVDAGKTFASLGKVLPNATQTVTQVMNDGPCIFRFIVTGTNGKAGKPLDVPTTIVTAAPGVVTGVSFAVS